jgi:ABC-type phosphate transport system substrate-binding protein
MSRLTVGLTIAATATVTIGLAAGPALADPPSGTVPAHTSIVGVGSDTTMNVVNQISVDYDKTSATRKLYSWDAVGSTTISTKTGCAAITRPNGSGAGISALKANARPSGDTIDFCVDFARSSRGPQTGDGATTHLAFVAYAKDAVTWSANSTTNATASLTTLQLRAIYSCNAALLGTGKTGRVTWNEVGGTSASAVVPVIPQSSSGTRSFFLSKIGVTTLGSCVVPTNNTVEENEGTNAIFANTNKANEIFP